MTSDYQQRHIAGEESGTVHINTEGRVIRPLLAIGSTLVDEARWHFDADGIRVKSVDAANVALVEFEAPADAFYTYDVEEELTVGWGYPELQGPLNIARYGKRTSDPVRLDVDSRETTVEVEREFDGSRLRQSTTLATLDPAGVREGSDIPNLDLPWSATVDVDAFSTAVDTLTDNFDNVSFSELGGELALSAEGDVDQSTATFGAEARRESQDANVVDNATSTISAGYLEEITSALTRGMVDSVTVTWGQEFPVLFDFERYRDDQYLYGGTFVSAPRIEQA